MHRALALILVSLAGMAAVPPRADLLAEARRVMVAARFCALLTSGEDGRISARTMDALPPDPDFVVWIATNPKSRKVGELRRNPKVTLYYFDEKTSSYASLQGRAQLVDDPAAKEAHWKEQWKPFYKERGAGMLLLRIAPERIEVSSPAKGLVSDEATWAPPSVEFEPGKKPEK
jgi:general stress protein 26